MISHAKLKAIAILSLSISSADAFGRGDGGPKTTANQKDADTQTNDLKEIRCPVIEPVNHQGGKPVSRSSFLSISATTLLTATSIPSSAISDPGLTVNPNSQHSQHTPQKLQKESIVAASSEMIAEKAKISETLEESISGFLSGAALSAAKTVVKYPLDTATVRLQMPDTAYSIFNLSELFAGSFRGISSPLISNIPAGAVFFAVKDAMKAALKENGASKWVSTSLAVATALPPYWLVRNPSEVVKTRQQAGVDGYGEGASLIDAFKMAMSKNETDSMAGIAELYTGYSENVLYALPADIIKFLCYDTLTGGRKDLPPLQGAMYGAFSTAVAQLVTTPLDVVRNRVMAGEGLTSYADANSKLSYLESFRTIAQEEGVSALFSGSSPRVGKAILSGAIQFATYEETKQSINKLLQTNNK